jgi:hypothetical protein
MGKTSFIDMTGKRFGCLVVLERNMNPPPNRGTHWICRCDCGNVVSRQGQKLRDDKNVTCKKVGMHPRKGYGEGAFNSFYSTTRANAKKRGLEFTISRDEARNLSKMDCHYCGTPPSNVANADYKSPTYKHRHSIGEYVYSGLDRVDNSIGYTPDNVVPCCKKCNQAKCKLGLEEFRGLINSIYTHWSSTSV